MQERNWLYQSPLDILIKASNGASDFGNKFGQPLIAGSVLTFEHEEDARKLGFDKVIIPEINNGQLSKVIRDNYLIDAIQYNKIQGMPIQNQELYDFVQQFLA